MFFKKYLSLLLAVSAAIITPIHVKAQSSQNQSNTMNNDNSLGNTGVVNQTAVYNLGQSATYGFRGIVCPRPSLVFSGSMNGNTFEGGDSDSYAVSGAIIIPLGGQVGRNCEEFSSTLLAREQAELEKFQIESSAEIVKLCTNMLSAGVQVDAEVYPILARQCSAVRLISQERSPNADMSQLNNENHTIASSEENSTESMDTN